MSNLTAPLIVPFRIMAEADKPHHLLKKPLFIYSLPTELLDTLILKGETHPTIEEAPTKASESRQVNPGAGIAGCTTCSIPTFTDVSQQRDHVRSDLHKFNLKRTLAGQKSVPDTEFDKMLDGTGSVLHR